MPTPTLLVIVTCLCPCRVICLCAQFEAVLQHGLRKSRGLALTAAALKQAAGFSSKTESGTCLPGCEGTVMCLLNCRCEVEKQSRNLTVAFETPPSLLGRLFGIWKVAGRSKDVDVPAGCCQVQDDHLSTWCSDFREDFSGYLCCIYLSDLKSTCAHYLSV